MNNKTMVTCVICQRTVGAAEDYMHRGSCGHHLCMPCALPMIRAGKGYCSRCPVPVQPSATTRGNLVGGGDTEQNKRAAAALRADYKVSALEPHSGLYSAPRGALRS